MRLTESPRDRAHEVTLGLAADRTLPNVLLGAFLGFFIQAMTGNIPAIVAAASGVLWFLSVVTYAACDEVKAAIEERRRRTLSDETDYYGIE